MQRHFVTCPLCECMCGLQVDVEGDAVKLIRGDRDDVWSKGYLCPKGTTLGHLHDDPDRIRVPMIREGDTWREATWDEAFARCEELIHGVLERDGISAFTAFIGNPVGHSFTLGRYMPLFIGQSGMPHIYSSGTVDQWPKNVSSILMYGNQWKIPAPDIQRTDYLVCMGGNPQASGGSLLACPDVLGELDAIRTRGGKVVVVDPRRTGTADHADEWVPILPGTDAAFLLAVCNVLFEEGLTTLGELADSVKGIDDVRAACAEFPPEAVAEFCRVPVDTIRRIAREFAAAPTGAVYGRIGLCNQEFGTLASWLVDVVNIVVGKFDRPGGLMWGKPINWPMAWMNSTARNGLPQFGRWRSRVSGVPEVLGQVPAALLAEEIATPGKGQIKALFTVAGNPVISVPDSARHGGRAPRAGVHDRGRQLPQRDDALRATCCSRGRHRWRRRTTTSCSGVGRRAAVAIGATRSSRCRTTVRTRGRSSPGSAGSVPAVRTTTTTSRPSMTTGSPRSAAPRVSTRPRRSRGTTRAAPSGSSTSPSAPVRGATATARCPTV